MLAATPAVAQDVFFTQSGGRGLQNAKLNARMSKTESDVVAVQIEMAKVQPHAKAPITQCGKPGDKIRWDGTKWMCETENDPTVQPWAKEALPSCAAGQVLSAVGGRFGCKSDGGLVEETDPTVQQFAKNPLPNCGSGEVLSVAGDGSLRCAKDNTGLAQETDPFVHVFARTDSGPVPNCASNQLLSMNNGRLVCQFDSIGITEELDPKVAHFARNDVPGYTLAACAADEVLVASTGSSSDVILKCQEIGSMLVGVLALDDLSDVETAGQTTGKVLMFDGTIWKPMDENDPTVHTWAKNNYTLNACGAGQVITYDGSQLVCTNDAGSSADPILLSDLGDVTISGPSTGELLRYNGTGWENSADKVSTLSSGKWCSSDGNVITCELDEPLNCAGNEVLKWNGSAWSCVNAGTGLGLGTMALQDANNVSITGGVINGTAIGGTNPSTGVFTNLAATSATLGNLDVVNIYGTGLFRTPSLQVSQALVQGNARVNGNLTVDGSLFVSGSQTIDGVTFANGGIQVSGSVTGQTVSATYGYFAHVSGSGAGLYGIPAGAVVGLDLDRITSGSTRVVVSSNTGIVNLVQLGNATGYFDPAQGYVGLGVSTTGTVSGTAGYFSGNVGIGTAAPAAAFEISRATSLGNFGSLNVANAIMVIREAGRNLYLDGNGIISDAPFNIGTSNARDIYFGTNNVERMRLTSGGQLAIGTQTPTTALTISGTLRLADGGETCDASRIGAVKYAAGDFSVCRNGSTWETFTSIAQNAAGLADRISSGTTQLVVTSATGFVSLTQAGTNTGWFDPARGLVTLGVSSTGRISATSVYAGLGGVSGSLVYRDGNGILTASNSLVISSTTGHMMVGNFTPNSSYVANSLYAQGDVYANTNLRGSNVVLVNNGGLLWGDALNSIRGNNASAGNPSMTFTVSGAEAIRIVSTGYVGIGTSAPAAPLNVAQGGGIMVGLVSANNIQMGNSLIQAMNNGTSSTLFLNTNGGAVGIGFRSGLTIGFGGTPGSSTLHVRGQIQMISDTGAGATCDANRIGAMRYNGGDFSFCRDGVNWETLTSIAQGAAGLADRISSGTTQLVVTSATGFVSLTQAGTNTGWFDPARGLVTLGVSSTGPISGTRGYFNYITVSDSTSGGILALSNGTAGGNGSLQYTTGNTFRMTNFNNGGGLAFNVNNSTEAMRIINNGYVGIGTSVPSSTLHIVGVSSSNGGLTMSAADGTKRLEMYPQGSSSVMNVLTSGGSYSIYGTSVAVANHRATFGLNGTYLGAGANPTNPSTTLHINGSVRLAAETSATLQVCDADRRGAIKYESGDFSVCRNGSSWETFSSIANGGVIDRIVSGTTSVVVNSATGSISLTAGGALVGITSNSRLTIGPANGIQMALDGISLQALNNGGASSLFLNSNGGNVALGFGGTKLGVNFGGTAVSSTLHVNGQVQLNADGGAEATCDANRRGAIKYEGGDFSVCRNGSNWETFTSIAQGAAGLADRISSGTTQLVVTSATGFVSLTQAGTNTGWFDPTRGLVTLGVSTTGTISGTDANLGRLRIAYSNTWSSPMLSSQNGVFFNSDVAFVNGTYLRIYSSGNDVLGTLRTYSNYVLLASSNNTDIILRPGSGNVGVSVTNPSTSLHLYGSLRLAAETSSTMQVCDVNRMGAIKYQGGDFSVCRDGVNWETFTSIAQGAAGLADRISSGTTQLVVTSNTGFVSLTQAGTNTGWFDPTRGLVTLGVSSTGPISGTKGYFSGWIGVGGAVSPLEAVDVRGKAVLISNDSSTTSGGSPRLRFVDTYAGSIATQPVWNFDNYRDMFRIYREPDLTSPGVLYLQMSNAQGADFRTKIRSVGDLVLNPAGTEGAQIVMAYPSVTNIYGQTSSTWNLDVGSSSQFRIFRVDSSGVALQSIIISETDGSVGILRAPTTALDVGGILRIASAGSACDTNRTGAIKYESGDFSVCRDGVNWETFTSIAQGAAGLADRISSGTTQLVVTSATGFVSLTQAGTNTGWFDPTNGLVTLGVSATGTVSGNIVYGNSLYTKYIRVSDTGTANNLVTMDIRSGSGGSSKINFGHASGYQLTLGREGNNGVIDYVNGFYIRNGTASNSTTNPVVLYMTNQQMVGISTTTPRARLDVNGILKIATDPSATLNVCDANRQGAIKYESGDFSVCRNGTTWETFTSIAQGAAGLADRITSGTTQLVVVSNTGFVSLTQAGTNTGWFDPTRGLVTLGVSSTGPISGTYGYYSHNLAVGRAPSSTTTTNGAKVLTVYSDGPNTSAATGNAALEVHSLNRNASVVLAAAASNVTGIYFRQGSLENSSGQGSIRYFAGLLTVSVSSSQHLMTFTDAGLVGIGTGTQVPSTTLHTIGSIRLGAESSATLAVCDANRTGAVRYTGGDFSFCRNGTTWETLNSIAGAVQGDRIVSGTSSVIVNSATGVVSVTANVDVSGSLKIKGQASECAVAADVGRMMFVNARGKLQLCVNR